MIKILLMCNTCVTLSNRYSCVTLSNRYWCNCKFCVSCNIATNAFWPIKLRFLVIEKDIQRICWWSWSYWTERVKFVWKHWKSCVQTGRSESSC